MPRIPYAEEGKQAEGATPVYQTLKERFNMVPNVVKVLGHSGPATQAIGNVLDTLFNRLTISGRVKEIAYLTVARENNCSYCQGHHTMFAKQAGMTQEEIDQLGDHGLDGNILSDSEKAVVKFALETTRQVKSSDEALDDLKNHFSNEEIAEIAVTVASSNYIQRIGKNFDVELEF